MNAGGGGFGQSKDPVEATIKYAAERKALKEAMAENPNTSKTAIAKTEEYKARVEALSTNEDFRNRVLELLGE